MRIHVGKPVGDAWRRYQDHLEAVLAGPRPLARLLLVAFLAAITWWVYVPLHELAHAGACVSCGGEVRRMTLAPIYGGSVAARHFDWVDDDTPYAGQLADFSPGSDPCYFWLVLAPFVVTPLARPLLRRSARRRGAIPFVIGTVLALMPLASVPGDFYEASSIVVTRMVGSFLPDVSRLRSDDLVALVSRLAADGATRAEWGAVAGAAALALLAALALTGASIPPVPSPEAATGTRKGAETI